MLNSTDPATNPVKIIEGKKEFTSPNGTNISICTTHINGGVFNTDSSTSCNPLKSDHKGGSQSFPLNPDLLDPDSNIYVANLPSNYGRDNLYALFAPYGEVVRHKFVQPDEASQPGYGFVQFNTVSEAHEAIKALEGTVFPSGERIYLSIALRKRSSLTEEPTNLYIKNLPLEWSQDRIRQVFGMYGNIRQSKVMGDGIAFVRYETHEEALNSIDALDKKNIEGKLIDVRFATRKTAANQYKSQIMPSQKTNENNLYVRNLPKGFMQQDLETLFTRFGKISSGKVSDNGVAFVRFAHGEDAERAIKELNGSKPEGYNFEEDIVVKLAHFDIGDVRNRWKNDNNNNHHPQHHNNNNNSGSNKLNNGNFISPVVGNQLNSQTGYYNKHLQSHSHAYNNNNNNNNNANGGNNIFGNTNGLNLNNLNLNNCSNTSGVNVENDFSLNALQQSIANLSNLITLSPTANNNNNNNINNNNNFGNIIGSPSGTLLNITSPSNNLLNYTNAVNNLNNAFLPFDQTNLLSANSPLSPASNNGGVTTTTSNNSNSNNNNNNNTHFVFPNLLNNLNLNNNLLQQDVTTQLLNNLNIAQSPRREEKVLVNEEKVKKEENFSNKQQEQGDVIFEQAHKKYPHFAPKITGMILKFGEAKTTELLKYPKRLEQKIDEAYGILKNANVVGHNSSSSSSSSSSNITCSPKEASMTTSNSDLPRQSSLTLHTNVSGNANSASNTNVNALNSLLSYSPGGCGATTTGTTTTTNTVLNAPSNSAPMLNTQPILMDPNAAINLLTATLSASPIANTNPLTQSPQTTNSIPNSNNSNNLLNNQLLNLQQNSPPMLLPQNSSSSLNLTGNMNPLNLSQIPNLQLQNMNMQNFPMHNVNLPGLKFNYQ